MSANLDLVRSICSAWERGDFSSVEWAHPEIEYVHADGPAPGSWRGLAGMARGWGEWMSGPWEEYHAEVDGYREIDEERVLALLYSTGRGKSSGLDIGQMWTKGAGLFQIRGGKVTKLVVYWDREQAFADLGLPSEVGTSSS